MERRKLKCGGKGKRKKALLGMDGAVTAAATIAAAGITAAATNAAAKTQAKSMIENAKTQAQSIKEQTTNNTNLQKENLAFTRQQNQENRQQIQDVQTTLQLLAGQQNMNDRMNMNRLQVKMGGKPKRKSIKSIPSYGGGNMPFKVTDGGGVIPIQTDNNGYGLYEIYGNDHEHTHKVPGGKRKTGVGIKFKSGGIVEGEGNQNTNQGELLYVTPNDAMFISKHSIAGFNPAQAVKEGINPVQAFNVQEILKDIKGLNDDGSRKSKTTSPVAKCGKRKSLKRRRADFGTSVIDLYNYNRLKRNRYNNAFSNINNASTSSSNIWSNFKDKYWPDYAGATYSSIGNLLGAGLSAWGNSRASSILSNAYLQSGDILADAYSQMKGIDLSEINRNDYAAPHTLAVIRTPNTNINPQLERIRRDAAAETKEINRGTLSSASRILRLAGTRDRFFQRMAEQWAYKNNADEQIKQGNAERITQTAQANADRDVQANKDYAAQRMSLLQYNNDISNSRIAGMAQARADALSQSSLATAQGLQTSMNAFGSALTATGQAFGTAYNNALKTRKEDAYAFQGMSNIEQEDYVVNSYAPTEAMQVYKRNQRILNSTDPRVTDADKERARNVINNIISNPRYKNIKFE